MFTVQNSLEANCACSGMINYAAFRKNFFLICGYMALVSGIIGIFMPLWPTTPFLLLSAYCFNYCSPKMHRFLLSNEYLKVFFVNHRSACGVARGVKIRSILFLWVSLGVSFYLSDNQYVQLLLLLVGSAVSWHLLSLKSVKRPWRNFTLVELMVSMGIIAILASMLMPAVIKARNISNRVACASNLRQIGMAISYYASDNRDHIPNITGANYSGFSIPIIKMYGGVPFALGKLVESYNLPASMFGCPDNFARSPKYVQEQWDKGGVVQSAYIYRETDVGFSPILTAASNTNKAMVMDFACLAASGTVLNPHGYQNVNILYSDGHVDKIYNTPRPKEMFTNQTFSGSMTVPECSFIWENADRL